MAESIYRPQTTDSLEAKLSYLAEEAAEVIQAVTKIQRWGMQSFNPELPVEERQTNEEKLVEEIEDLNYAISLIGQHYDDEMQNLVKPNQVEPE